MKVKVLPRERLAVDVGLPKPRGLSLESGPNSSRDCAHANVQDVAGQRGGRRSEWSAWGLARARKRINVLDFAGMSEPTARRAI